MRDREPASSACSETSKTIGSGSTQQYKSTVLARFRCIFRILVQIYLSLACVIAEAIAHFQCFTLGCAVCMIQSSSGKS